jgi:hypothetical protein
MHKKARPCPEAANKTVETRFILNNQEIAPAASCLRIINPHGETVAAQRGSTSSMRPVAR